MKKAVIIIPTFNEVKSIIPTLTAVDAVLSKISSTWRVEVLVVDDTSPDGTAKVVSTYAKYHNYVHLLVNTKKAGLGAAYLKGMAKAFDEMRADVVFEFDADLSHDPTKIPIFLQKIDQGYDLVLGSRYIKGGSIPKDWGFHRKFLSVVGNLVIMIIFTDFRIRDWTSGYRAITKELYEAVKEEMSEERFQGYTFQIAFLHKTIRKGFKVVEVPFHFVDREEGVSKLGSEYIKNNLLFILKVRMKEIIHHRLFKFGMVGILGAIVQLGSLTLFRKFLPYQLSYFFSVELAVLSNFIWSNLWTFADRTISATQIPFKFAQFNLTSIGSILIQQGLAFIVENFIGFHLLFVVPLLSFPVDTGFFFAIVGIFLGMFWNFFAYSKIIWRKK